MTTRLLVSCGRGRRRRLRAILAAVLTMIWTALFRSSDYLSSIILATAPSSAGRRGIANDCPPSSSLLCDSPSDYYNRHNHSAALPRSPAPANVTIIILASNGLASLRRLVGTINGTDYDDERDHHAHLTGVNIWIRVLDDPNAEDGEGRQDEAYDWARRLATTTTPSSTAATVDSNEGGSIPSLQPAFKSVRATKESSGGIISWVSETYAPLTDEDGGRLIILNDDVALSPTWFARLRKAFDDHGETEDVAGFALKGPLVLGNLTTLASTGRPFLYPRLTGTGGVFVPRPAVWRDFVEWTLCSSCMGINDIDSTEMSTAMPWVQHFDAFMEHHGLYCWYHFAKSRHDDGGPSRERGARTGQEDARYGGYSGALIRYDVHMDPVVPSKQKFIVITTAVGEYREVGQFEGFLGSLRKYYSGPVMMLIGDETPEDVTNYLSSQNVHYETMEEGKGWHDFNVFRFVFYGVACDVAEWCLAVDFRDVKFQSSPFPRTLFSGERLDEVDLVAFAHNLRLHKSVRGGRWFHKQLAGAGCGSFKGHAIPPSTAPLLNAGAFYARPSAMGTVRDHMARHVPCNDQVTFNMLVHSEGDGKETPLRHMIFPQGYGPVNNVAFSSFYTMDTMERIGGRDCFLSPVVHQFDRLFQSQLINENC